LIFLVLMFWRVNGAVEINGVNATTLPAVNENYTGHVAGVLKEIGGFGVGAVVICSGNILLEKRKNEPGKGKWSISGGIVELGEEAEQTAVREVWEETNLTVEKPELTDVVDNVDLDENGKVKYHFVIIDYLVRLKG
jgi:8-oxo-dGTP pyrophosphatase MutT (NUDIX family)